MIDWLLNWVDAEKKTDISEWLTKRKTTLIQKVTQNELSPATIDR